MVFMIFVSFIINIIMGYGFYSFDLATDMNFSIFMFNQANRNFTMELQECKKDFDNQLDEVIHNCRYSFNSTQCLHSLKIAKAHGENCFENEDRFKDILDWWIGGVVSAIHLMIPIVFSFVFWSILERNNWSLMSLLKIPLPPITKMYKFYAECELFVAYTKKGCLNTDGKMVINMNNKNQIQKSKEKLRAIGNTVNFSMIIEAAMEASFQFFFQTVYLMPTLIISFIDASGQGANQWTDLFNWRLFSILMSFLSLAWAFYNIRLYLIINICSRNYNILMLPCCRNCATGESFTGTNQVLLTLKVILDCASRTVIFSAWLYVTNDGQFSSLRTLTAFYLTLFVLILYNATCNTTKHYWSPRTWIGIF